MNEKLKKKKRERFHNGFFEKERELAENERVNELSFSCCDARLK